MLNLSNEWLVALIVIVLICFAELTFLPIHPIANAICSFGAAVAIIVLTFSLPDSVEIVANFEWWGWLLAVILTTLAWLYLILQSMGDAWETRTEDGKTYIVGTGVSAVAIVIAGLGTASLAAGVLGFFI